MPTLVKPSGWAISGVTPPPSGGTTTPATIRGSSGIPYSTAGPHAVPAGLAQDDVLLIHVEAPDANGRSLAGFTPIINNVATSHADPAQRGYLTVLRGRIGATVPTTISLTNGTSNDSGVMVAYSGVGNLAGEVVTPVFNQVLTGDPSPITIASGATVSQDGSVVLAATHGVGIGTDGNGGGPSEPGITGWDLAARHTTTYNRFWAKQFDAGAVGNISFRPYGASPNLSEEIFIYFIEIPGTPAAPPPAPVQRGALSTKPNSTAYPIAAPAGLQTGDTVFITINKTGDVTPPALTGFSVWSSTTVQNTSAENTGLHVLYGTITGAPPASFSPTNVSASDVSHVVAFSGADLTNMVIGTEVVKPATFAATVAIPGITVADDNSLVLAFSYIYGLQGTPFDSGVVNVGEPTGFYTGIGVGSFDSGPTGNVTITTNSSSEYNAGVAVLMSLPPGSA